MAVYFAYGSNLDWRNWSEFCARHDADPHSMKPIAPAFLPDVELVFNYRSVLRAGGALNIQPRKGQIVQGVLFEVNEHGWEVLDLKESVAAGCYARTRTVAITHSGRTIPVITYVVTPVRREGFVSPSGEYTDIVLRGLSAHGLPADQYLDSARGLRPAPKVNGVFVYGTLMRHESRFGAIQKHGPEQILQARTRGRLHETAADYPMLDLQALHDSDSVRLNDAVESGHVVHGEFVHFGDLEPVLETLDEVEDFAGYASNCNVYERTVVEVDTGEASRQRAWTYVAADRSMIGRHIESGCWRTHRGVRSPGARPEQTNVVKTSGKGTNQCRNIY